MSFTVAEAKDLLKQYEMPEANIKAAANDLCRKHLDDLEDIKNERDEARKDAKKLTDTLAEFEAYKKEVGEKYITKEEYEKTVKAFSDYKTEIANKDKAAAIDKAVRAHLTENKITGNNADIAVMAMSELIKGLELDGEKLKDTKAIDELISGKFKAMQDTGDTVKYTNVDNPPNNNGAPNNKPSRSKAIADSMHAAMFGTAQTNDTKGA